MQGGYYGNGSLNLRGVRLEQGSISYRGKGVGNPESRIIVGKKAHEKATCKEQGLLSIGWEA